jgi:predicted LPLAT superfamily acyltransferase
MSRHAGARLDARPQWVARSERGSEAAMRLIAWLTFALGRRAGRLFLYPICAYFFAFSARARRASRDYLGRVLGRRARLADLLRHYHCFASTVHDRLFLVTGRVEEFDVSLEASPQVMQWLHNGRGCILLGSHLGSFEILRARSVADRVPPVNVLMHVDNAAKTNRVLDSIAPELKSRLVVLGQPESMLRIEECLARGEIVGILGDRVWNSARTASCEFLGAPARFPLGPLFLAGLLGAPVILFFGLYRGGRRYEIRLEAFAERIMIERGEREASVRPWLERYAQRLERQCRRAPYNWFNFYDYWQ